MIEKLIELKNKTAICLVPSEYSKYCDSIDYVLGSPIVIERIEENREIISIINNSKIKKIFLIGYNDIYRFILPVLNKKIKVCWIFIDSFSNLSNPNVRNIFNVILEYYDRSLIDSIGCTCIDNKIVLENAGYVCKYIEFTIQDRSESVVNSKSINSKSIGLLGDDYDANNNFYNQLAALTFINYDICKYRGVMQATQHFINYFNIRAKKMKKIEDVLKDNIVNLYVNFTNTNNELIIKSFNYGVPVIVGNSNFYDNSKYLKEHLVVKSDDDVNEIADKIIFAMENNEEIIEEYNKLYSSKEN